LDTTLRRVRGTKDQPAPRFCGFVIATLYLPKPKTQAIEALRRKA